MERSYLSIPKLQRFHRWSFGMDNQFHHTHHNGCNYLSMLGLKLIHASKNDHWHLGCSVLYMCHQKDMHSLLFAVTTWLCDNEILLQKLTVRIKMPLKWASVWHIRSLCWHFVVNYSSTVSCSWLVILIESKSTSAHYLWGVGSASAILSWVHDNVFLHAKPWLPGSEKSIFTIIIH